MFLNKNQGQDSEIFQQAINIIAKIPQSYYKGHMSEQQFD